MRILPLIVLVACVAWQASAVAQDEGEARAAPARGLLKRGLANKGKPTTTTTPAPQEEAEYEDEAEYVEEGAQEPSTEAPASSTEGKKLVAGGVRPFRSNVELLEALKRRRAQAAGAKQSAASSPAAAATQESGGEAPAKASYSKKRFNNAAPARDSSNDDTPAPAKPSRSRFGRPSSRSVAEAEPEEQNESAPPARASRTFSRRGN